MCKTSILAYLVANIAFSAHSLYLYTRLIPLIRLHITGLLELLGFAKFKISIIHTSWMVVALKPTFG